MTEKFNGEYQKTGSGSVSNADKELARKADEKLKTYLPSEEEQDDET
jgi:hypothetical protein